MTTQTISHAQIEHGAVAADSVMIDVLSRLDRNDPVSRKAYEIWLNAIKTNWPTNHWAQ